MQKENNMALMNKKVQAAQYVSMQKKYEALAKQVDVLQNLAFNGNSVSTVGAEFRTLLADLDIQQACNRYVWEGLPNNLTSWQIEQMLYYKGQLCGFFMGGVLYILPFAQKDGVNVLGQPNAVQPVAFNGAMNAELASFGGKLIVSNLGAFNPKAQAALLYDKNPLNSNGNTISRYLLNNVLTEAQADILGRIRTNVKNSSQKVVFYVDSEAQKRQTESDLLNAYGSEQPFVIVVRNATGIEERTDGKADTLQGNIQSDTQALFEAYQSFNSIRCGALGITNGGAFEKKERKITAEADDMAQQTDLVIQGGLDMRKLFLSQMKLIYPQYADILGKIKVYIRGSEEDPNAEQPKGENENFEKNEVEKNEQ